jgi:hypothetical protein
MQDTGHILFDRYGCGARRRKILDEQIKSGKRGFKTASEEMWGSLRVPFDAAVQTLRRGLVIDQDFEAFHEFCSTNDVPFSVISAGLKPVLKQVLDDFLGEEKVGVSASNLKTYAKIYRQRTLTSSPTTLPSRKTDHNGNQSGDMTVSLDMTRPYPSKRLETKLDQRLPSLWSCLLAMESQTCQRHELRISYLLEGVSSLKNTVSSTVLHTFLTTPSPISKRSWILS